ncbi:MAG: hypothetical protein K2N48_00580, partial [Muribaculaceae bacterium]|nr:hypothetical protein [Muribaculaceae bacterium]
HTARPWNCPLELNGQRRSLTQDYVWQRHGVTLTRRRSGMHTSLKASTVVSFLTPIRNFPGFAVSRKSVK